MKQLSLFFPRRQKVLPRLTELFSVPSEHVQQDKAKPDLDTEI